MSDGDVGRRLDLRTDIPHSARIYDHILGGKDNFAADRAAAAEIVKHQPTLPISMRTKAEIERFFDGLDLIDPGVTAVTRWRPDRQVEPDDPVQHMYGGVAIKR